MIVTLGAAARDPEPSCRHRRCAIDRVEVAVFLVDRPAFARGDVATDETGRDELIGRGVG